jgi:uncharacterized membrane protein YfcA
MREVLGFLTCGVLAGILAGVFGLGGGMIIVPFLVLVLGFTQFAASGTSLVALLGPVGLLAVISYYNSGQINGTHIRAGLIIAAGMFFGAYFGSKIALSLSEITLRRSFCIFLVLMATRMWFKTAS